MENNAKPKPGSAYSDWVGQQETVHDHASLAPVKGLLALFDDGNGKPKIGDAVPPLWHWLYFLPQAVQSEIGPDGHPKRGGFLPPVDLPRRMFAGSQLQFHSSIHIGDRLRREGRVADIIEKKGKSGALVFVTVDYKIFAEDRMAVEERQTIVYRAAGGPTPPIIPGPQQDLPNDVWHRCLNADPVRLFRFSALTFNGHRIHYDRDYAVTEEGYPGLVVHGPLLALSLLELVRTRKDLPAVTAFSFRGEAPAFDGQDIRLEAKIEESNAISLVARRADGKTAMSARVN